MAIIVAGTTMMVSVCFLGTLGTLFFFSNSGAPPQNHKFFESPKKLLFFPTLKKMSFVWGLKKIGILRGATLKKSHPVV